MPVKLSPVLNSSPWSSNCSHRPKNIDPFPLPPTLTVSPTACGPEPGRCCPGKPSLQTRSDRLEAGKATDFRFTYAVRLSPSPVWQLSGTSVKLNHKKPTLLPLTAFKNKSFCWRPRYVRLDFKIKKTFALIFFLLSENSFALFLNWAFPTRLFPTPFSFII